MAKKTTVDYFKAQKLFRKLSEKTGRSMRDIVRQGGRVASMRLAAGTAPFGGAEARPKLIRSIEADYAGMINSPGRIYELLERKSKGVAMAFWRAKVGAKGKRDKSGRFTRDQDKEEAMRQIAEKYLGITMNPSVSPADYYQKTRAPKRFGSGGITPKKNRISQTVGFVGVYEYVKSVGPIVKKAAENIFRAKAGWIACAKLLGGTRKVTGLPKLPSLAAGAMGRTNEGGVVFGGSGTGSFVMVQNRVPYVDSLLPSAARRDAINLAFKNMVSYARATLRGIAKQARAEVPA